MSIQTEFGEFLKNVRRYRKRSMKSFAEAIGTSEQRVILIEKGQSKPSLYEAFQMAEELGFVITVPFSEESLKESYIAVVRKATGEE